MTRVYAAFLVLAAAAVPAQAHFVFLVPSGQDVTPNRVTMIFSDNLKPDPNPMLLKKIAQTELFARPATGKMEPVKHTEGKDVINVAVPAENMHVVAGICKYGVIKRGEGEPFLLNYYPKTFVGLSNKPASAFALALYFEP